MNGVFNRTMTFRTDSDVVVRQDCNMNCNLWLRSPSSDMDTLRDERSRSQRWRCQSYTARWEELYCRQVTANLMGLQTPLANFSHYTYTHFREHGETSQPPIVWFVSHCNAHSGRSVSMIRFWLPLSEVTLMHFLQMKNPILIIPPPPIPKFHIDSGAKPTEWSDSQGQIHLLAQEMDWCRHIRPVWG